MRSIDPHTDRLLRQRNLPLIVLSPEAFAAGHDRDALRRKKLTDLPDAARLRAIATAQRRSTVDHLEENLARFIETATANGDLVHSVDSPAAAARLAGADSVAAALVAPEVSLPAVAAVFLIAETGHVCVLSEEGSPVTPQAVVAGIDAVVPTLTDLAVILKLFARNSSGRSMTRKMLLLGGPGRTLDDPAVRVILLDNGRRAIRAGPFRDLIRCIGCNACGVVCPVYAPATTSSLPVVRAILDPLLLIDPGADALPWASTRCGACGDVCPVGIDLSDLLDKLRRKLFSEKRVSLRQRIRHRWWGWVTRSSFRYRWMTRWRRRSWRKKPVAGFPPPAVESFQDLWRKS